jgi:hypothetical protein
MEQLARVQDIRNVFQKILCVPERWKGTERRGFARDNNLQALFAWYALFSRPGQLGNLLLFWCVVSAAGVKAGQMVFCIFMSKTRFVPFSHFTTFWNMIWLYDMSFA